ncbi:MAG: histidinol-phosphate transaminase [Pseudomonadota bacterium]
MSQLANVHAGIAGLQPYKTGKPIDELTRELGITDIVKLASNENPRGPGPEVQAAVAKEAAGLSRYPDGSGYYLRAALVEHLGVDGDQITLGNGSNDVLDLIARVTVEPGYEAIISEHSFVVYRLAVAYVGGTLVEVPAKDYGTDLDGILAAITPATRTIFIANPNNPTGTWVGREVLQGFLEQVPAHVWVVLDEAYFEFGNDTAYPNGIEYLKAYPNVIVTRTFSKIHGLAALRVGYSVSTPEFADLLNRARHPFNVNSMGQAAAVAALGDTEFVAASRQINQAGMQQITEGLDRLQLNYIPSMGNFVTFDCGGSGPALFEALLRQGVIVRPVAEYGLPNHVRVSIGLEHENQRFLAGLTEVLGR